MLSARDMLATKTEINCIIVSLSAANKVNYFFVSLLNASIRLFLKVWHRKKNLIFGFLVR